MYVFTLIFAIIAMEINSGQSVCSGLQRRGNTYVENIKERLCVTQITCNFSNSVLLTQWILPNSRERMESIIVTILDADRKNIYQRPARQDALNATFELRFTAKSPYTVDISSVQSKDDPNYASFNTSKICRAPAIIPTSTPNIQTQSTEGAHGKESVRPGSQIALIAGLGGGGVFMLIVIVLTTRVILKWKWKDKPQDVTSPVTIDRGDIHHDLPHLDNAGHEFQPLGNDSIYDHMATSDRLDSNKGQETDRSSDDPTYDHTGSETIQQISTTEAPSGDVYACVVKDEKKSQVNDVDVERQIGPKGDLYTAVVMKKE